jgi:hypothetical protein
VAIPRSPGGGAPAKKKVRKKKPAYSPPPTRSDAAQNPGKKPVRRRTSPNKPAPAPVQRGHSSEGGKTISRKQHKQIERENRGKSDAAQGNSTAGADKVHATKRHKDARKAARAAYLFGPVSSSELSRYKRAEDVRRKENTAKLTRELEGKGSIAKGLSKAADRVVGSGAAIPSTGGGPNLGGRGTFKKPRGAAAVVAPRATPLSTVKGGPTIAGKIIKDAINLPANAIPAVYEPGAAVVEAAQGDTKRAKRVVENVKQNDPIYNTVAAGVAKVKGDDRAARSHIRKAGKSIEDHPGYFLAEVAGVKGTAGRAAGRTARSGALGKKAKRAASTKRESARLAGSKLEQQRDYSPDLFRKGRQVVTERLKVKRSDRTRAKAKVETDPGRRAELTVMANRQDPRVIKPREIRRRVDERVAANEDIRRVHRADTTGKSRVMLKQLRKSERGVISLVSQRITRADKSDLRKYRDELDAQHDSLDAAGKRANRALTSAIDDVLNDPKADMARLEKVAREYKDFTAPGQKKLTDRALLADDQAVKARLIPYAVRNMGARHNGKEIVGPDDTPLSVDAIRAHMRENDVEEPAFLSQAPNQRGGRNFNIRSERAQAVRARRRTGEATTKGTFDADPETLIENAARAQGLVDATDGFAGFVDEFATRGGSGKVKAFTTRTQADKAMANIEAESGSRYRAVRINPWGANKDQLRRLLDEVDADAQLASTGKGDKSPLVKALEDALSGDGDGPWAIVPEEAAIRLQEHVNTMGQGPGGKVGQILNSTFRRNVLSLSPKWALGNVAEGALRSALAKAGPRSYFTGRQYLKSLGEKDLKAAEELAVRAAGGGHYSSADRFHVQRNAEQFQGSALEGVAQSLGKFWRSPGPKQTAGAWHAYTTFVFEHMRALEAQFQTAMLGKALLDRGLKANKKAIDEFAAGGVSTDTAVALGRAVDRMYGRYGKLSPEGRLIVAYYTPFIAWTMNAAYFITRTLPRDHPTALAVIAAAQYASEEWRKDKGLDKWMDGAVPGWLQGSIPTGENGKLRVSGFTPFGLAGDPLTTAGSAVLPQFSGILMASKGMDWTGRSLEPYGEADDGQKAAAAASAMASAFIPGLSLGLRLEKDGPAALNPLKPVKPPEKKKKLKKSTAKSGAQIVRGRSTSSVGAAGLDFSDIVGSGPPSSSSDSGSSGASGLDFSDLVD